VEKPGGKGGCFFKTPVQEFLLHTYARRGQNQFTQPNLPGLQPAFRLAEKMGKGLGSGSVLLRPLSPES
jgi:hypothetical protein